MLGREGITGQNLVVDVDDTALDAVLADGADARYGARALKREVQRKVVLPLAMMLTEQEVLPDSILKVSAKDGQVRIRVVETEASRAHRAEQRPVRDTDGRTLTLNDLGDQVAGALGRVNALARELDLPRLSLEQTRLLEERNAPEFWKGGARAERVHRELRAIEASITRLARLHERGEEVRVALAQTSGRAAVERVAARIRSLDQAIDDARREFVLLGWEGSADAMIEIRPVGGTGRGARDLLVEVYTSWAEHRRMLVNWLREPREDDEPAMLGIKGHYAFGMLRFEAGLHRVRLATPDGKPGRLAVASVRVAAWGKSA